MSKKFLSLILTFILASTLMGCGTAKSSEVPENGESQEQEAVSEEGAQDSEETMLSGKYAVLIEVRDYGDIFVELDADAAPITVTNFMKLVHEDFYTNLTFHRIIEGFMMQGGQSYEKPAENIKGEFAINGVENPISHERGVISMARANDPNSASSQFFICHEDSFFLDGQYAAFGHVVSGMDVVDSICTQAIVEDDNGTVMPENQPIIDKIIDVTDEYRADALGGDEFIPSNELESTLGRDTFESYEELISLLPSGTGYAYADVLGADEPVLLVAGGCYDNGDGNMAAIDVLPYLKQSDGSVKSGSMIVSDGTAYPIAVLDGILYHGSNHTMSGDCVNTEYDEPGIMSMFYLYEDFDTDANVTYGGFIRSTNSLTDDGAEVAADDSKPLEEAFEAYQKASTVYFTIVE